MKAKGNGITVRSAMLADALNDGEPTEIEQPEEGGYEAPPVPTPPVPVPADMAGLIAMLASALNQNGAQTAEAIKSALSDASALARSPIPEGTDHSNPKVSVYSHPEGDATHPRTKLTAPMFLGIYNQQGQTVPAFEIHEDTTTEPERVLLNRLTPGAILVERNDGTQAQCRVVDFTDDLGQPIRRVIAVPETWLAKEWQAQMPSLKNLLTQLTAA